MIHVHKVFPIIRALVLVTWLVVPTLGQAQADSAEWGPIPIGERNPLYGLFLTPEAQSARLLPAGSWRWEAEAAYANVFEREQSDRYFQDMDLELLSNQMSISYGLSSRWQLDATLSWQSRWGGFLDSFIQDFHATFDLPNDNREDVPNDRFSLLFTRLDGSAPLYEGQKARFRLDDTLLAATWLWHENSQAGTVASLRFSVKAPTGSRRESSESFDAAIAWLAQKRFRRYELHATLSAMIFDRPEAFRDVMRPAAFFISSTLVRPMGKRMALSFQIDGGTAYFRNTGLTNLNAEPLNLILSFAKRKVDGGLWRLSFAEDLSAEGPSVDFSVYLHYRGRLRPR